MPVTIPDVRADLMRMPIVFSLCLAAVLLAGGSRPSHADFRVCNSSAKLSAVAVGYSDAGRGWVSRGWWAVPAGGCQTLIGGDLTRGIYYVFGQDEQGSAYAAPAAQIGGYFCAQPGKFELRNNDYLNTANALDCTSHGFKVLKFQQVDVDGGNFTFTIGSPAPQAASQPITNVSARANPQSPTASVPAAPVATQPLAQAPVAASPTAASTSAAPLACQRYPNLC